MTLPSAYSRHTWHVAPSSTANGRSPAERAARRGAPALGKRAAAQAVLTTWSGLAASKPRSKHTAGSARSRVRVPLSCGAGRSEPCCPRRGACGESGRKEGRRKRKGEIFDYVARRPLKGSLPCKANPWEADESFPLSSPSSPSSWRDHKSTLAVLECTPRYCRRRTIAHTRPNNPTDALVCLASSRNKSKRLPTTKLTRVCSVHILELETTACDSSLLAWSKRQHGVLRAGGCDAARRRLLRARRGCIGLRLQGQ